MIYPETGEVWEGKEYKMRKVIRWKKALAAATGFFMMAVSLMPMHAEASGQRDVSGVTYTVTYRPGKLATFGQTFISQCSAYVSKHQGSMEQSGATGAIKMTVPANSTGIPFPTADDMVIENGYENRYIVNADYQIPKGINKLQQNIDYVVDYAAIVDLVEYSVRFVDAVSGEDVARPVIGQGNIGDRVTYPSREIDGYTLVSSPERITLTSDASENVLYFRYSAAGADLPASIVETLETVTVPGGVVPAAGGGAGAGAGAGGAEPVTVEDEPVPLADEVIVEDEEVPLGNQDLEEVIVEDEEIPLANQNLTSGNSTVIYAGLFALSMAMMSMFFAARRKRVEEEE